MVIQGAPNEPLIEAVSSGERIALRRAGDEIGIRMPEGRTFGLRPVPMATSFPAGFGWIGNPQPANAPASRTTRGVLLPLAAPVWLRSMPPRRPMRPR